MLPKTSGLSREMSQQPGTRRTASPENGTKYGSRSWPRAARAREGANRRTCRTTMLRLAESFERVTMKEENWVFLGRTLAVVFEASRFLYLYLARHRFAALAQSHGH